MGDRLAKIDIWADKWGGAAVPLPVESWVSI